MSIQRFEMSSGTLCKTGNGEWVRWIDVARALRSIRGELEERNMPLSNAELIERITRMLEGKT